MNTMDKHTSQLLEERTALASKNDFSEEDAARLRELNSILDSLPYFSNHADGDFVDFMMARREVIKTLNEEQLIQHRLNTINKILKDQGMA